MKTKLWVAGQLHEEDISTEVTPAKWEFLGVFSDESKAVAACRDEKSFVGPAILDEVLPVELFRWPGAYYPLHPNETRGPTRKQ